MTGAQHDLLVWIDRSAPGRELVGGKGASLARLAALGAPVPPAFCLTTAAYRLFRDGAGLPAGAHRFDDGDAAALRRALESAAIPPALRRRIRTAFAALNGQAEGRVALAVRSSAVAEDGADRSFAGLHDTILDVRDLAGLEAAIRRCWGSLWTERAVAYRQEAGLDGAEPAIAVVVQQLVRTDVSFVVFTADPVSGDPARVVINAAWGLGEAVVSGLVTPDQIVVGPDGRVAEYAVADKATMVIPGEAGGGTRTVAVPRLLRQTPALTTAQAEALAALARGLADRLGYPADIEGGWAGGQIALFQARPITTVEAAAASLAA